MEVPVSSFIRSVILHQQISHLYLHSCTLAAPTHSFHYTVALDSMYITKVAV